MADHPGYKLSGQPALRKDSTGYFPADFRASGYGRVTTSTESVFHYGRYFLQAHWSAAQNTDGQKLIYLGCKVSRQSPIDEPRCTSR